MGWSFEILRMLHCIEKASFHTKNEYEINCILNKLFCQLTRAVKCYVELVFPGGKQCAVGEGRFYLELVFPGSTQCAVGEVVLP